jgi:hypothetical protein
VDLALVTRTRDVTKVHRALETRAPAGAAPLDDLARAVARVRQLVRERLT